MINTDLVSAKKGWEYKLSNVVVIVFLIGMCSRTFYHLCISSDAYLDFVTDDFFYYFLPAKNLILRGISSFDGITITNGYHPLWMLLISVLYWISGGSEQIFFALLSIVSALSSYLTFRFLWNLNGVVFPTAWILPAAILIVVVITSGLSFLGMEVTLTIPLYAYLLLRISRLDLNFKIPTKQVLAFGFLSSLLILSRLDTGVFVLLFLIFFGIFYKQNIRNKITFYFFFCIGGILVPIYFFLNYYWFGHFMTVSSMAKTLKTSHALNIDMLVYIAFNRDGLAGLFLAPITICLLLFYAQLNYSGSKKIVCYLVSFFPLMYYLILFYGSDWFLNRWYLYPLPFCFFISIGILSDVFLSRLSNSTSLTLRKIVLVFSSFVLLTLSFFIIIRDTINWQAEANSVYVNAHKIEPFVKAHPGIYAMGDQAGLTAYILKTPVIQLEGLISDFKMYDNIRNSRNLDSVLTENNVDYLIETSGKSGLAQKDNCYFIEEPHTGQAGKLSKKMNGFICTDPVYRIENPDTKAYIFKLK